MESKPFDLVIFGASGFIGRLVVRHFLGQEESDEQQWQRDQTGDNSDRERPPPLKWAVAGRSRDALTRAILSLEGAVPSATREKLATIPILIADAHDAASLAGMVDATRVVVSTVNPFILHGTLLVEACVKRGVHYCDLTGEMLWVQRMIKRFDRRARETGAVIVPCCGFDAVVADLTAFELANRVANDGQRCSAIKFFLTGSRGGFSGGSFASSIAHVAEARKSKDGWKTLGDPLMLCVGEDYHYDPAAYSDRNGDGWLPQKERDLGGRSSAFFGAVANKPVVYRSNLLLDELYGSRAKFHYHHRIAIGGLFTQLGLSMSMFWIGGMLYTKLGRSLLRLMGPKSGSGPSESVMQTGSFSATAFAYSEDDKLVARADLAGSGDPGFLLTSKILGECALCLASRENPPVEHGGFLTPASAFGRQLTSALTTKGIVAMDVRDV